MSSTLFPPAPASVSAIILAAGVGRRLGQDRPKILLEIGGKSLLERHLAALSAHGVTDIAITVGFRADLMREELARLGLADRVGLIDNPRYREGSIVSLWAQRARLAAGRTILLMDGDVLYDGQMIARLLAAPPENVLLFDKAIESGDEPVKICLAGERIVDFAKQPVQAHDRHGESVGFFRFSPAMAALLAAEIERYLESGQGAVEYESAIRDLILRHPDRFGCADVSDLPWTEIDFDYDLARARDEIMPRVEEREHA